MLDLPYLSIPREARRQRLAVISVTAGVEPFWRIPPALPAAALLNYVESPPYARIHADLLLIKIPHRPAGTATS